MLSKKNAEYTVTYRDMLGVDFSIGPTDRLSKRYAYAENMYRDYESGDSALIESVPGFRKIASFGGKINGIYSHKDENGEDYTVIHAKNRIYRFKTADRDSLSDLKPIASMQDKKSSSFRFGTDIYILDGEEILKITENGTAKKISANNETVYVPTTFYNGVRVEQRNLLTDRFREKYIIGAAESVIYGTPGLMYKITSEELKLCSVVGISESFRGILNIPAYTKIGTQTYKVDEIDDNAFRNHENIIGVKTGPGLYRIGKFAFYGCRSLSQLYAYDAPVFIDDKAFGACPMLNTVYLGTAIRKFGEGVFEDCQALLNLRYASSESNFLDIENASSLSTLTVYTFQSDLALILEIPINTPLEEIISVTVGAEELTDYETVENGVGGYSIVFSIPDRRSIEGKEVVVYASAQNTPENAIDGIFDFHRSYSALQSGFEAICGCTVCESFDGRVFLSGNPALPGVVFYSSRESGGNSPLYFGAYDYFCDGFGTFGVSALLSCADSLLVFKSKDDGGGSIFYHTAKETGIDAIPKIYPVSYTHNGIGAIGKTVSFFDDPIFISKMGVSAIDKRTISLERSIACRSHNVNAELLGEDIKNASLTEWCGYLAIGVNGKIFLADSRSTFIHDSGSREYEWYFMKDIGTYENARTVYRYSSVAEKGYSVHPMVDSATDKTVYSASQGGKLVYFVSENGEKYEVYPTEEETGGIFHPMIILAGFEGDLLFFGTDNGDLCIFNNDKRGVAPDRISSSPDFDAEEYERTYGRRIHPSFYSFGSHSMRCGVRTAPYDCSMPGLTKNTVKHSLTLKCRLLGSGNIRCEVKTNRSGYTEYSMFPNSIPDFSDLNFAYLTLDSEESVSLPINEKEKGWIDKEISVYCDDFCSPIGVYSLSYRYTEKGRIKHT